ncbi:MAG: chlorophyll synthase ChlG [Gemmatimonadota bacterium]
MTAGHLLDPVTAAGDAPSAAGPSVPRRVPTPDAVLALLKPHTWFPPMWAFSCGVVSSGVSLEGRWPMLLLGIGLTGPLVCASSQAVNDWFDRHVDAINEPQRPIPSGRMPGRWGLGLAIAWSALSLAVATLLGPWGFVATTVAVALSWAYSAPPLRLKRNGWLGGLAVGRSYETLAWVTGAAVALGGARPSAAVLLVALLYGLGAHGILVLNDFKAVEGDRRMGIRSLPARHGEDAAAWIAVVTMYLAQAAVLALHAGWGTRAYMWWVAALILAQFPLAASLLVRPGPKAALYVSAFNVPFYVITMMITAFAIRNLGLATP